MLFWEQGAKALEIEFEASGRFGYLFEDEDNSVSTEETLDAEADKQQLLNYLRQMFEDDCVRR